MLRVHSPLLYSVNSPFPFLYLYQLGQTTTRRETQIFFSTDLFRQAFQDQNGIIIFLFFSMMFSLSETLLYTGMHGSSNCVGINMSGSKIHLEILLGIIILYNVSTKGP